MSWIEKVFKHLFAHFLFKFAKEKITCQQWNAQNNSWYPCSFSQQSFCIIMHLLVQYWNQNFKNSWSWNLNEINLVGHGNYFLSSNQIRKKKRDIMQFPFTDTEAERKPWSHFTHSLQTLVVLLHALCRLQYYFQFTKLSISYSSRKQENHLKDWLHISMAPCPNQVQKLMEEIPPQKQSLGNSHYQ